tara:strand:- start:2206 stop:2529 length:324 start_codon:yes stop_codon:yes gene_type:complete
LVVVHVSRGIRKHVVIDIRVPNAREERRVRVLDSPEEYECEANDERVEEDGFARHWWEEERLDAREGGGHDEMNEFRLFSVSLSHARTRTHTLSLARSLPRVRLYSM